MAEVILGLAAIALGLVVTFAGLQVFFATLPIIGFIFGFMLGGAAVQAILVTGFSVPSPRGSSGSPSVSHSRRLPRCGGMRGR